MERFRCPTCYSPVYASLNKGKMAAVPLAILAPGPGAQGAQGDLAASTSTPPPPPPPPPLLATHHMYYGDRVMDVPAGGLLRTSTRPTVCSDEPRPRVCMSIAPEGKSCSKLG